MDNLHTYTEQEKNTYCNFINNALESDEVMKENGYIPIDKTSDQIFDNVKDGQLLAHLLIWCVPGSIDMNKLIQPKIGKPLNTFQLNENVKYVLKSIKDAGVNLINIGSDDIIKKKEYLILAVLFAMFKKGLDRMLQDEMRRNREALLAMGIKFDDGVTSPDKILCDFYNDCLKKCKSPIVCRTTKDISNATVISSAFHAYFPAMMTQGDMKQPIHSLSESVLNLSAKIGVPQSITAADLAQGDARLCFIFAAQTAVTIMQRPKVSEKFLVNFVNKTSMSKQQANQLMEIVETDGLYETINKVMKLKDTSYVKEQDVTGKALQLLQLIGRTDLPQILDEEKLTQDTQKEFLLNFTFELYCRSLTPFEKLQQWAQKHIGEKIVLGQPDLKNGFNIARIVANISDNEGFYRQFVELSDNTKRASQLSTELQKLSVPFVYGQAQLTNNTELIQHIILHEIYQQYPFILDKYTIDPVQLTSIFNYQLGQDKQKLLKNVAQDCQDMDRLAQIITTITGATFPQFNDQQTSAEKANLILNGIDKQLKIEKCMKGEDLADGGEKYINSITTNIYLQKGTNINVLIEYINLKYKATISQQTPEEKLFFSLKYLLSPQINAKTLQLINENEAGFQANDCKNKLLEQIVQQLGYNEEFDSGCRVGTAQSIIEAIFCDTIPQDDYLLQEIQLVLQKKVADFTQNSIIEEFIQKVLNLTSKDTVLINEACQKLFGKQPSQLMITQLKSFTNMIAKHFLYQIIHHKQKHQELLQELFELQSKKFEKLFSELQSDKLKECEQFLQTVKDNQLKNMFAHIFHDISDKISLGNVQQAIQSRINVDKEYKLTSYSSAEEMMNAAKVYQQLINLVINANKKVPYTLEQMVYNPELFMHDFTFLVYSITEKPDDFYISWVNKLLKKSQYPKSIPSTIEQIGDGQILSLVLSQSYTNEIKLDQFSGLDGVKAIQKAVDLTVENKLSIAIKPEEFNKNHFITKLYLKQIFIPMDPLLERVYIPTYDLAIKILFNQLDEIKEDVTDLQKMMLFLNKISNVPKQSQVLLQQYDKPLTIAQFISSEISLHTGSNYCKPALLANGDANTLNAVVNDLLDCIVLPKQLLLKGVDDFISIKSIESFKHILKLNETDPKKIFQAAKARCEALGVMFPFEDVEALQTTEEKFIQLVQSFIYKKLQRPTQQLEEFTLKALQKNNFVSPNFNANNRAAKVSFEDNKLFNLEVFKVVSSHCLPNIAKNIQSLDGPAEEQAKQLLNLLQQNGIVCNFVKPTAILNNKTEEINLILDQMFKEIDLMENKLALQIPTIEQAIKTYCKNQCGQDRFLSEFKEFINQYKLNSSTSSFAIKNLATPKDFITIFKIFKNIQLKDAQIVAGQEFENILQQIQDSKIQTLYVTNQDMFQTSSLPFRVLMTDILQPIKDEEKLLITEYNKYLKRAEIKEEAASIIDLDKNNLIETLYGQMYPCKFVVQNYVNLEDTMKLQKMNEFRQQNGVPQEVLTTEKCKALSAKLSHIPYNILDDFIIYDEANSLEWINKIKLIEQQKSISDISIPDMLTLAKQMDNKFSVAADVDPYTGLKACFENSRITNFYNEQQLKDKNKKQITAVLSQIKLNQDYKFNQLQKVANNLFQVNGISFRISDKNDIKTPEAYLQTIPLISQSFNQQVQQIQQIKNQDQQLDEVFKLVKQLNMNIAIPLSKQVFLSEPRAQRQLFKDLLACVIPQTELILYVNRLNERAKIDSKITQLNELTQPLNFVSFLHTRYPDVYPRTTSQPSFKELQDLIVKNEAFLIKLNEVDLQHPVEQKIILFISEHFQPIDETSDKRKLPNNMLIEFLKSRNVFVDNLGSDLMDGSKLIQLMQGLDPTNFSAVNDQETLFGTLKALIPKVNFLTKKDAGNQRHNSAALTAIYETYMLSQQVQLEDLTKWVNNCLKHQQNITNKMGSLKDLQDGQIIAALLQVLEGDAQLYEKFIQQKQAGKQFLYLVQKLKEHGLPEYVQESDFKDLNEYALQQTLSQLYCDTDQILDLIQSPQQLLLNWIRHKFIIKSANDIEITAFNAISQQQLLKTIQLLYEYIQSENLDDYLESLHNYQYCAFIKKEHLMQKYNYASIWYLFDCIRQFEAIPKQHLMNFMNVRLKLKKPVDNLGQALGDCDALTKLLNYVCPQQCDLKPISIQNKGEKAVLVCDYAGRVELGHLLTPQSILENEEQNLHLFVEELYRKIQKSEDEYKQWINVQMSKARQTQLYLQDSESEKAKINVYHFNCLYQRQFPEKMQECCNQHNVKDLLQQEFEVQQRILMQFLKENQKCDYVTEYDIESNSHRMMLLLDMLYKPLPDYSNYDRLPLSYIYYKLRSVNSEIQSDEDSVLPQNIMSEVYQLKQNINLAPVYEQQEYDDQAQTFVNLLKPSCPVLDAMDGYDFTYDQNATLLLASEVVKTTIEKSEQQCLQFVNQMLWKINGGEQLISSLAELHDGVIIDDILVAAGIVEKAQADAAQDKVYLITETLYKTGFQYNLQQSDLQNNDICRVIVGYFDNLIIADKHIDTQKLINWANKIVVEDQIQEINELFTPNNIARLSKLLCATDKAKQLSLAEIDPKNPNYLELFMHQCQKLDIGKKVKLQVIKDNNLEAMQNLLTEIYGYDLPPETQLIGMMTDLLKKAGIGQHKLDNLEDLKSAETLNAVISVMDPGKKKSIAKDPFAGLQKNIRNLGLNNYMQPEDLTQMDKMKVLIRSALQNLDDNQEDNVIVSVIDKINKNKILLLTNKLSKQEIRPVSFQDVRDSCMLAQIIQRISPGSFDDSIIFEQCTTRDGIRAWDFNKVLNYNACVKVLQNKFEFDMRGVSGKDLCTGDLKYLSSVMWRLSKYETARVEQQVGDLDSFLKQLGVENIDWTGVNSEFYAAIINMMIPDMITFQESQGEQQKLQTCLDYSRSIGMMLMYRPQDLMAKNVDASKSFVAQIVELVAEMQAALAKATQ